MTGPQPNELLKFSKKWSKNIVLPTTYLHYSWAHCSDSNFYLESFGQQHSNIINDHRICTRQVPAEKVRSRDTMKLENKKTALEKLPLQMIIEIASSFCKNEPGWEGGETFPSCGNCVVCLSRKFLNSKKFKEKKLDKELQEE